MHKVLVALVVAAALYAAYPVLTLWRIQYALQQKDPVTLDALIDWPRVRESVRHTFVAEYTNKSLSKTPTYQSDASALGEMLGATLGMKMLDPILEGMVSSNGIFQIIDKAHVAPGSINIFGNWAAAGSVDSSLS